MSPLPAGGIIGDYQKWSDVHVEGDGVTERGLQLQ